MNFPLFIARRYLLSPKKQGVINIISLISITGITIGTAALVIILSVFNGIDLLLAEATGSFSPDLTITPARGKFITIDTALERNLERDPAILHYQPVIEETALATNGARMIPVTVKGVGPAYDRHVNLSRAIRIGRFALEKEGKPAAILGVGVASALQARLGVEHPPVTLYYPARAARSPLLPSLESASVYPVAIFSAQQEIDARYLVTGIDIARQLFHAGETCSKIEITLRDPRDTAALRARVPLDPSRYKLSNKRDLNASFYAMMRSEKLVIFLLLLFITGIASFNVIASISMLIIDKKEDLATYRALGTTPRQILSIFRLQGLMITAAGLVAGLLAGLALCLLQEHLGLVTLGQGSYLVEAYPVKVAGADILAIIVTVIAIGAIASHFPVRYLTREFSRE